jgi:hypothetical protein
MVVVAVLALVALTLAGQKDLENNRLEVQRLGESREDFGDVGKKQYLDDEINKGFMSVQLLDEIAEGNYCAYVKANAEGSDGDPATGGETSNQNNSNEEGTQVNNSSDQGSVGNSSEEGSTTTTNSTEAQNSTSNTTDPSSPEAQNSTENSTSNTTDPSSPEAQNSTENSTSNTTEPSSPEDENPSENSTSNTTDPSSPDDEDETSPDPDEVTCPKVTCSSLESEDCLEEEDDNYILHPCNSSHICSFTYSNLSSSRCVENLAPKAFVNRTRGNSTKGCNKTSDCKEGWSCNHGTCQHLRTEDSYCSLIDECEKGTVCNKGRCVEYFSVAEGNKADYSVACASGILINGTCQPAQLTSGKLPKKCKRHSDCTASDGVTKGTCACALDKKGKKYCKLHRSDPISLKHLEYSHEESYYQSQYYTLLYNTYPVNLFAEECFVEYNKEMKELNQAEDYAKLEHASFLLLSGIMMIVF